MKRFSCWCGFKADFYEEMRLHGDTEGKKPHVDAAGNFRKKHLQETISVEWVNLLLAEINSLRGKK